MNESKQDKIRLFIKKLIEKKTEMSKFRFKIKGKLFQVPKILRLARSNKNYLKRLKWILKKNAVICEPGSYVTVLQYPNLKDSSLINKRYLINKKHSIHKNYFY